RRGFRGGLRAPRAAPRPALQPADCAARDGGEGRKLLSGGEGGVDPSPVTLPVVRYSGQRAARRVRSAWSPPAGVLRISIRPPHASAMSCTIARPRPAP